MPRDERRGARLARREEGASLFYVTDEQRSQAGCIGVQIGAWISVGLPKDPTFGHISLMSLFPAPIDAGPASLLEHAMPVLECAMPVLECAML